MAVIAEFRLGEDEFALGKILKGAPDMSVELDRVLPASNPGVPYVWATGGDFGELEEVIASSTLIDSVRMVDQIEDSALYRIQWAPGSESLLQELSRTNVAVLEANRDDHAWFFRLRFDDHGDLSKFHQYCDGNDITYELTRVYPADEWYGERTAFGLSHAQFDALVLAVDRGYFEVPRAVTLSDLGDEIGVSQQAVSERVRRAANTVLRTVLLGPASEGRSDP